IEREAGW
ncbi:hypothetical protein D043_1914B, partial [Vibrio parahaemolyticus EKP-021]